MSKFSGRELHLAIVKVYGKNSLPSDPIFFAVGHPNWCETLFDCD